MYYKSEQEEIIGEEIMLLHQQNIIESLQLEKTSKTIWLNHPSDLKHISDQGIRSNLMAHQKRLLLTGQKTQGTSYFKTVLAIGYVSFLPFVPNNPLFFFSSFFNDKRHAVPNYNQHMSMRNQDSTPIVWTVYYFFFFLGGMKHLMLIFLTEGFKILCKSQDNCHLFAKYLLRNHPRIVQNGQSGTTLVKKIRCSQDSHRT